MYTQTLNLIEEYLIEGGHNLVSRCLGEKIGFIAEAMTPKRTFFEEIILVDKLEAIYMDVYPGIHCRNENIHDLNKRVKELNAKLILGNFRIDDNNSLYLHIETWLNGAQMQKETFEIIEFWCMSILDEYVDELDRISHKEDKIWVGTSHENSRWQSLIEDVDNDLFDEI